MHDYDLIVIGGGAAGFYGAIQTAILQPGAKILILEKSNKVLAKVKVSGGGRCNVTQHCFDPLQLARHYPRGEKPLKSLFKNYHAKNVVEWFEEKKVALKAEEDGRMFPVTDSSQTIIDCFLNETARYKIKIELERAVENIKLENDGFGIYTSQGYIYWGKKVLIAIGGNPNLQFYQWIQTLNIRIVPPIPSLFTFNDSQKVFKDLMGVAVPNAEVRIATTKFLQTGPLLITHWGLSGPAVIKLSAWAAEYLHDVNYQFTVLVSWIGPAREDDIREQLKNYKALHGKQKIYNYPLFDLPSRLWQLLCTLAEIEDQKIWAELPQKNLNKLLEGIIRSAFQIKGKTTFKEEFVTCGGVDLADIDINTMESKKIKNLFFAGEVLNIDGETGGYNFQAAWTTSYTAAVQIAKRA
ncbi:MAG TPA: NAD(P)/FAD-dependent oxidoreductase [Ohtaekwangia sp.]|uniref:NAD(P)/FAD-dependent oxidoreductase n=1 Tax=Ohtaekwangia sp. TaxID=2066019 RepID=UPI002F95C896